ncbi:cyclic nucleotide-binding protein [Oleiphilus messinensis]|uniref:Cyclic nucleotide-binding protein n=2 Tax=Oleiphilus messinensis TaxID=141451 RepID=A0A1Y0I2A4_9GAMM|nr:cyclic nucleotide-binding protein [Oleiphilus messinensis]
MLEIQNFLARFPPFDELPESALHQAASQVEISYFRSGSEVLKYGDEIHDLYIVRSGAVEVYRRNGELYNRLEEGDLFGQIGLLMQNRVRFPVKAIEDTLVYCLPESLFTEYCEQYEHFSDFVEVEDTSRLRHAVQASADSHSLATVRIASILTREPTLATADTTVQQVARKMVAEQVSYALITASESEQPIGGKGAQGLSLLGMITEHDLSERVIADGRPLSTPISEVMSTEIETLDANAYVYEAMMLMLRHNTHHLPIVNKGKPVGVLEMTDIVRYESQNSLLIVNSILQQQSQDDLAKLADQVHDCFVRMVQEDANSHMIGSAMAIIGRTFKQRLLELAEEALGSPPIPYCFLALGSMARDEQLVVTDQDNALILDETFQTEQHGDYFEALANWVCDGLNRCGYPYCAGQIMATNPQWRKTLQEWKTCFAQWIDHPDPQALLNSSIFFDLDGVWGHTHWADQLNAFIVERARRNKRFLACLARNALNRTPPLGFFKDFVMEKDGRHNNSINLKRRGTAPLADVIRVHSLAAGSVARNSFERLDDIIDAGILPEGRGPDLRDAMEFISMVRIRHQASDLIAGRVADNNIEPENLSAFERRNLKDAFQVLSQAQNFLKFRYQGNGPLK